MRILPDILRGKYNQTLKFDQLVQHGMRNIFLKKSWKKCGGETSSRLFFKNKN